MKALTSTEDNAYHIERRIRIRIMQWRKHVLGTLGMVWSFAREQRPPYRIEAN
ncbi:MAG: hypothetical protein ACOCZV_00140 [Nanoarchaeota archaeon]